MREFHVGDKVRVIHNYYGRIRYDALTEITEITDRHIRTADGVKYKRSGVPWGADGYHPPRLMHEEEARPFVYAVRLANLQRAVSELGLLCKDANALIRAKIELERGINPEAAE